MSAHPFSRNWLLTWPPVRRVPLIALFLAGAVTLLSGIKANAASATYTGGGSDDLFSDGSNWSPTTAPGSTTVTTNTDTATFNSAVTTNNVLNIDSGRNLGFFTFTAGTGSFTIGGLLIGTTTPGSTPTANTGNSLLLSSGGAITITPGVATAVTETFDAPLVLEGATTTTAGTYAFTNNSTSTSSVLVFGGGITSGTSNTVTLTLGGTNTGAGNIISGILGNGSGTLALTEQSAGTWSLTGINTYTGATTVNNGTLKLDFTGAATAATRLSSLSALVLGGGTLSVLGTNTSGQTTTQTVKSLTVNAGNSAIIDTVGATGLSSKLVLNAITRNAGGTVDFTLPTTGTITTTTANALFTGGQQTILGGYATVGGTTWAVSGSGATAGTITGLTTYSTTYAAGTDVSTAAGTFAPGPLTINSLRFNSGAVTVNTAGNLTIATGGILETTGSGVVAINNNTLTSGNGQDLVVIQNNTSSGLTIASTIADNGTSIALTKSGAGTLTLTGTNTYTGGTFLNGGVIDVGSAGALGTTGTLTFAGAGGTLQYSTASATDYSSRISTAGNQSIKIDTNGDNVIFASVLAGAGTSLTKLGAGTLTLSASNTFTGSVNLNAGVVNVGNAGALGVGGVITFGGGTLQYGGITTDFSSRISTAGSQAINIDTNSASITFATGLSGTSTTLTKLGLGTLTLTGASSFTGATTVDNGTLALSFTGTSTGATRLNSSSALVLGGGTFSVLGTATSGQTTSQTVNGLTLNAGGSAITDTVGASGLNSTLVLGGIVRNTGGTVAFTLPTTGSITTTTTTNTGGILGGYATVAGNTWAVAPATSGGAITGLASGSYTASTAATTAPGSSANVDFQASNTTAYAGQTINSLRFNTATATTLTLSGTNIITTGGILVTSTVGNNLSTITGGTLEGSSGGDLVVIQNDASNGLTIGSTIVDDGSATALTKSGTGTLTLTGSNSFTGGTFFNGGIINVGSTGALGTTGTLSFAGAGGTLQYSAANTMDYSSRISTAANQTITIDTSSQSVSFASGLGGNNTSLTKLGTGTLTLNGASTYTGPTTVSAGTLTLGVAGAISGGVVTVPSTGILNDSVTNGLSGAAGLTINQSGGGTTLSVANNYTGATTVSAGTLTLGVAGAISGSTVTVPAAGTLTDSVANGLSGSAGLAVTGSTVTLGVANNYTGPTTLSSGTLNLNVAGAISGGTLSYTGGTFNPSVANAIAGTAALSSLINFSLPYSNTYSGGTTLGNNTVTIGDPNAFGTGTIATGNTTFANSTSGSLTIPNAISNGGYLYVTGAGPVTFSGLFTNTGANGRGPSPTNTGGLIFSGGVVTKGGSNLVFSGSSNVTISGVQSGGGGLTYSGSGVMTLSNSANTNTGGLVVTSGTLQLGSGANFGAATQLLTATSSATTPTLGTGIIDLGGNGTSSTGVAAGAVTVTGPAIIQNGYLQPTSVTISAPGTGLNTGTSTISANIIGTGTLTSAATTTAILSGANTYTGATTVAGMLTVTGSLGTTAVAVNSGGTFTGGGTSGGSLTLNTGGIITPGTLGTSTGMLTANNLTFNPGGTLTFTLSNTDTTTGLLNLNGALIMGTTGTGAYNISLSGGMVGNTYELASFGGGVSGFTSSSFTALGDTGTFNLDTNNDVLDFTVISTPVPEPREAALLVLSSLGLLCSSRGRSLWNRVRRA